MKTKLIVTISAAVLLPWTAFTQTPPNPPPNPPGPPVPPIGGGSERHERNEKKVPVTYLGVETSEVPSVVSEQLGLAKGFGLVVDYVVPDSPAAAAGVQQNDIIKMLNDQILTESEQLSKLIRSYSEGTTVSLTLLRKGKEEKVTAKLSKKDVPQGRDFDRHGRRGFPFGDHDMGDFGLNGDFKEQMENLRERLGETKEGIIHDVVMQAQSAAQQARDEAQRPRDEAQRVRDNVQRIREQAERFAERSREQARRSGQIAVTKTDEQGGLKTTNIDIGKAQIVYSDDKGELRIEKIDGKKVLTAKDAQGLLQFSGPVETQEDLSKVPVEVRDRYQKLQEHDLPSAISSQHSDQDSDSEIDEDEDTDGGATQSFDTL